MMAGLIEVNNEYWECLDCHKMGDASVKVPDVCPKCKSVRIYVPPVKKGGPFDHLGPEKKY